MNMFSILQSSSALVAIVMILIGSSQLKAMLRSQSCCCRR